MKSEQWVRREIEILQNQLIKSEKWYQPLLQERLRALEWVVDEEEDV